MISIDLSDPSLRSACHQAVLEVLETMFFELPLDTPLNTSSPAPSGCCATARFEGSITGALTVVLTANAPQRLAASFLGLDDEEAGPAEWQSVVIELANVLCGATMSRMEPAGRLRIEQPVLLPVPPTPAGPWLSFALECGRLEVHVEYGALP